MMDDDKLRVIEARERRKDLVNLTRECRRLASVPGCKNRDNFTGPPYSGGYGDSKYCHIVPISEENPGDLCPFAGTEKIDVSAYKLGKEMYICHCRTKT